MWQFNKIEHRTYTSILQQTRSEENIFFTIFFRNGKIGNLLKKDGENALFAKVFFQSQNFVHPSLMASTLKAGFQEGIDHHAGKSCADNPAAKAQNVGVVVQTGVFCAEAVGAAGSADSLDLVGSHRDADAGAANQDADVTFSAGDFVTGSLGNVGIIHRVFVVAADIYKVDSFFFQMFFDFLFEQETAVVTTNYEHNDTLRRI